MNLHNRYFTFRVSKHECLFFVYTKTKKYGITWDNIYGWDWGSAKN
jgi:hypothetical protein